MDSVIQSSSFEPIWQQYSANSILFSRIPFNKFRNFHSLKFQRREGGKEGQVLKEQLIEHQPLYWQMSSCTENIQGALRRTRNFHLHPKQREQKEAKTTKRKGIGIDVLNGRNKKEKTLLSTHNCMNSLVPFPMLGSRWWLLCVGMTDRQTDNICIT